MFCFKGIKYRSKFINLHAKNVYYSMSKNIKLKKGLNINLVGEADKVYASVKFNKNFVIKPTRCSPNCSSFNNDICKGYWLVI